MTPNDGIVVVMTSSDPEGPRFLTLADVAETLSTSVSQVRALVTSGSLRAIQIGGRGQWRVERVELEAFIRRAYEEQEGRNRERSPQDEHEPEDGHRPNR
jgi:excisionase family DNA binding protein